MTEPDAPGMQVGADAIAVELRAGKGSEDVWRPCQLSLVADGLRLARADTTFEIRDVQLDGLEFSNGTLVLHTAAGAPVSLRGSTELERIAANIVARVCTMREVTRALRGFGARRGKPGEEHDSFFEPLLSARRRAESARTPEARLAEFDAPAIGSAVERTIHAFATTRFPSQLPERRALHETLREIAEPLHGDLARLAGAAAAARGAPPETRLRHWREWLKALDATFASADRCWLAILPQLPSPRKRR